ncbi:MAG: hypothetical protein LBL46_01195 [Rickettsiales bacterium]|jgi:hypothetical protein|nr:hypothetical protein [Rickettsiales bacterium]
MAMAKKLTQGVLFPAVEKQIAELSARINDIWHIAVYKDKDGFFHPGVFKMDIAPSGAKRVMPIMTYDAQKLKTEEEASELIENILKKQSLTQFWAEVYSVPENAWAYLKNPMTAQREK